MFGPLPIDRKSFYASFSDNMKAALAHHNRVRTISLGGMRIPLELLSLQTYQTGNHGMLALSDSFLSGSAPRLRLAAFHL
jgi:hypothetical protein